MTIKPRVEIDMQPKTAGSVALGAVLAVSAASSFAAAADERDACSLLTQARVSTILGVSMGNGVYPGDGIPGDHPHDSRQCAWPLRGQGSSSQTRVVLYILGVVGTLTPTQRFDKYAHQFESLKTPVSGVGDDAFYVASQMNTSIYVRKGSSVFQVIVFGVPKEQIKSIEKTLAEEVVAKL
jgi:hypothetical protein